MGLTISSAPDYSRVYDIVKKTMITVFVDQLGADRFDPARDWETPMEKKLEGGSGLGLDLKNVREIILRLRKDPEYGSRFRERLPDDEKFASDLYKGDKATPLRMQGIIVNRTMISELPQDSSSA
ncbi:MAG TPA: hypothetical protein VG758_07120 [Hyphomicrobiaceae bacterium]|jgi:hypothetical protein|nr:hypothetical protein [Hyphomicrobiaceae bacterium]